MSAFTIKWALYQRQENNEDANIILVSAGESPIANVILDLFYIMQ